MPSARPTPLDDARAMVLAAAAPLPAASVSLGEALGMHLSEDVVATAPLQRFDNSAMDGYAVRAADLAGAGPNSPLALEIVDESRAGHPAAAPVGPGEAIAISTGGPASGATTHRPSPHAVHTPRTSVIAGPPLGPVSPRSTRRTTTRCPTTCGPSR